MFIKNLEIIFISIIFFALVVLANNYYQDYLFKHSDISQHDQQKIINKEHEILQNMQKNFGFTVKFPLIVTGKFKGRLYGLTSYQKGYITIYLNKKVMKESMSYMVESVIAHEYAHALLFHLRQFQLNNDGHSELWQQTCVKLGGVDCRQYVNQHEIIMSKMPFR